MRFHLFLNHISASQTIRSTRDSPNLDCYSACNPYNCSVFADEDSSAGLTEEKLYRRIGRWRVREESFCHLVFDPSNNRIYETDAEGVAAIRQLQGADGFSAFSSLVHSDTSCRDLYERMTQVFL